MRIPVRRPEPDERRDHVHPSGVVDPAHELGEIVRGADRPEPVPEPLHGGTGDEHGALERIRHRTPLAEAPQHGGQQPVGGSHRLRAHVREQERPRPESVLRVARREACLAERRRLLVARDAGDRHGPTEDLRVCLAPRRRRRPHLRQHRPGDLEQAEQVVVPVERPQVQQLRPRGVRHVRRVYPPAGQSPHEPGVHGSERELAPSRPRTEAAFLEDVPDLRTREVRIQRESGALADERLVAVHTQPLAEGCRDPALPDDCGGDGPAGRAVPDDRGLALVGDTDGGDGLCTDSRHDLARHAELATPDVVGIVGDMAGRRKALGELALGRRHGDTRAVEGDGSGRRGPLVEREDDAAAAHRTGGRSYSRRAPSR